MPPGLTLQDLSLVANLPLFETLESKCGQFTWNMSNADGTQDVVVGFQPEIIFFFGNIQSSSSGCWGSTGGLNLSDNFGNNAGQKQNASGSGWLYDAGGYTYFYSNTSVVPNGFRNTYTKGGSPTSTMAINYLALRRRDTALKLYVGQYTRDMSLATGNVAYTGFGIQPKMLFTYACVNGLAGSTLSLSDGAGYQGIIDNGSNTTGNRALVGYTAYVITSPTNAQRCTLASFDADGVTLSWTKDGTPTETIYGCFMALR